MQPSNAPKPVMDVTAPRQTPPPTQPEPMPVRQAPVEHEQPTTAAAQQSHDTSKVDSKEVATNDEPTPEAQLAPGPTAHQAPRPMGVIIGTIFIMVALSAAAIYIYLQ